MASRTEAKLKPSAAYHNTLTAIAGGGFANARTSLGDGMLEEYDEFHPFERVLKRCAVKMALALA